MKNGNLGTAATHTSGSYSSQKPDQQAAFPQHRSDSSTAAWLPQHPGIRLQVLQRTNNAIANAELWLPSQSPNHTGIQKDKWAIADPAALATSVMPLWLDPKLLTDPVQ
jgi:hypothetical protein